MGARGIALPTRAINGRLKMISDDDYIEQLIKVALGSSETNNPFLPEGMSEDIIFAINDEIELAKVTSRVMRALQPLEEDELARFVSLGFESINEQMNIKILYENLETGERKTVFVPLPEGA